MTPERRRALLEASRLGRAVLRPEEPKPVAFADPSGARGDLDPEGRWRTVAGHKIHITSDDQIDAGGPQVLRDILADKAGLTVKGSDAGGSTGAEARQNRKDVLHDQIVATLREIVRSPRVALSDLKPGDHVASSVGATPGFYRVTKLVGGGKGVVAVNLERPADAPVRLAPRKGIGDKPEWSPAGAFDGYHRISAELANRAVNLAQQVDGTAPLKPSPPEVIRKALGDYAGAIKARSTSYLEEDLSRHDAGASKWDRIPDGKDQADLFRQKAGIVRAELARRQPGADSPPDEHIGSDAPITPGAHDGADAPKPDATSAPSDAPPTVAPTSDKKPKAPKGASHRAEIAEGNVVFKTGVPVTFRMMRNLNPAPKPRKGTDDYQQKIEPAGRYMTHDAGGTGHANPLPNHAYEEVTFRNPLVVPLNTGDGSGRIYDDNSWKMNLSREFGGKKGQSLSNAVARAGHDGIVTVDKYGTSEIVDLRHLHAAPKG